MTNEMIGFSMFACLVSIVLLFAVMWYYNIFLPWLFYFKKDVKGYFRRRKEVKIHMRAYEQHMWDEFMKKEIEREQIRRKKNV